MDINTTTVVIIALFVVVIVGVLYVFRQRGKFRIQGPWNLGLKIEASNDPPPQTPGVSIEGAKSRGGGLIAEDNAGRGVQLKEIEVQADIRASNNPPKTDDASKDPKGQAPM